MTAALAAALVLPGSAALAAGGSDTHGGGHPTGTTGSLYSDLVIAYRAADGTPILREYYTEATEEADAASHCCVQPVSFERVPGVATTPDPLTGKDVYVLPLQGEWIGNPPATGLPVEEIEPCDVQPQYAMFVSEAELERLNLGRTSEDVLQRKLDDVQTKFDLAESLSLDPAGRIAADGAALDASPEYAAMYASLMETGTIPGLKEAENGQGVVSQAAHDLPGFKYDAYDLAAVALGTAAGKTVPITVDTVQYYNRVVGFPAMDPLPTWGLTFLQSTEPDGGLNDVTMPRNVLPGSENFVNFGGFTYNRAATFPGSVTWLDVPTLTWQVSRVVDVVPFTEVTTPGVGKGPDSLTGLQGFTQMADDVRAVINYLHENEVIPGFYMDPVGVDTTAAQNERLTSPATDLVLPDGPVFETQPFDLSAFLFNPQAAEPIANARMRVTVTPADDTDSLTVEDLTVTADDTQAVPFEAGEDGSLVGWWGPEIGFPVPQKYNVSTGFTATLADGTAGAYDVLLELVDLADMSVPASDAADLTVLDNVPTVLWAGDVPTVSTQGAQIALPVRVYAPTASDSETPAQLQLTVSMDDPTTEGKDSLAPASVRVYGEQDDAMVAMSFTATDGILTGTWDIDLTAGENPVTWYLSVVEGAPVGQYTLDVSMVDGVDEAGTVTIGISAPADHKSPNAPVVEETSLDGDSATIVVSSTSKDVETYEFVLVNDFDHIQKVYSEDGSVTFTGLDPGAYKVKITAIDKSGNRSDTVNVFFDITDTSGGGGGGALPPTTPTTPADPGDGDPTTPPVDPEEPGDGAGEGGPPDTFVGKGPRNRSFVLGHSVTYRLRSTGEDVQYRVMLNNRFDQVCDSNVCVVDGLESGKNVLRFAAQANGQRDDTPVVRKLYVPRNADALRMTKRWRIRENVRAFDGDLARTNQAGQVVRTRARNIKRIALVVAKGKGNGQVEVYLGQRLLTRTPIDLSAPRNQHRVLVPVTTFRKLQTGFVRVKVVSQGKPVRIEGIGIVNR